MLRVTRVQLLAAVSRMVVVKFIPRMRTSGRYPIPIIGVVLSQEPRLSAFDFAVFNSAPDARQYVRIASSTICTSCGVLRMTETSSAYATTTTLPLYLGGRWFTIAEWSLLRNGS